MATVSNKSEAASRSVRMLRTAMVRSRPGLEDPSVIRASNDSFRGAWIERRYENGRIAATERWTAILTVVFDTPRDAQR